MECELCGRKGQLISADIEGTLLSVCNSCANLGKRREIVAEIKERKSSGISISTINPEFATLVKKPRLNLGLSMEELGKRTNEKTSVLERVEKGMRPTDVLARKLEKALKINLLDFQEE